VIVDLCKHRRERLRGLGCLPKIVHLIRRAAQILLEPIDHFASEFSTKVVDLGGVLLIAEVDPQRVTYHFEILQ